MVRPGPPSGSCTFFPLPFRCLQADLLAACVCVIFLLALCCLVHDLIINLAQRNLAKRSLLCNPNHSFLCVFFFIVSLIRFSVYVSVCVSVFTSVFCSS